MITLSTIKYTHYTILFTARVFQMILSKETSLKTTRLDGKGTFRLHYILLFENQLMNV